MPLPDRREDEGDPPGPIGPVNARLPSIRDGEPPMPVRTQKYVPPPPVSARPAAAGGAAAVWLQLAMTVAMFIYVMVTDANELPPEWVLALIFIGIWIIPQEVLNALVPGFVHRWLAGRRRQSLLRSSKLATVQTDSGDTWITHVPSIPADGASPAAVRFPFRIGAGLIALLCMAVATLSPGDSPLLERLICFAGGVAFGGIALVPDGDLTRMIPRISRAPRLPAGDGDGAG
jgi:hypothetical protein